MIGRTQIVAARKLCMKRCLDKRMMKIIRGVKQQVRYCERISQNLYAGAVKSREGTSCHEYRDR